MVKVQLVRSLIGTRESHRATVRGLGLGRLNSVSELQDSPAVRGMINKVSYLVKVLVQSVHAVVLDGALVLDWAKPLAVDTKVKSHVLADFIKLVLRVDRCQCIVAFQSAVLSH